MCQHVQISTDLFYPQKIDTEVKAEIDATIKKSRSDAEVGPEELTGDIYALPLETEIRGTTPFNNYPHKSVGKAINL